MPNLLGPNNHSRFKLLRVAVASSWNAPAPPRTVLPQVTSTQNPTGLNSLGTPIQCNGLLRNTRFCMAPHKKLCTGTGRRDTNRDQKNRNGGDAAKPRRESIRMGKSRGSNNNLGKPYCAWLCKPTPRTNVPDVLRTESDRGYPRRGIQRLSACLP